MDRVYLSNCYRCLKPEYDCVCEECDSCFEKIDNGLGHVCLTCGKGVTKELCGAFDGHCAACDSIALPPPESLEQMKDETP